MPTVTEVVPPVQVVFDPGLVEIVELPEPAVALVFKALPLIVMPCPGATQKDPATMKLPVAAVLSSAVNVALLAPWTTTDWPPWEHQKMFRLYLP